MERSELNYDPHTDLWSDTNGNSFVMNKYRSDEDIFIRVSGDVWSAFYQGETRKVNWHRPTLPPTLVQVIKDETQTQLKRKSPLLLAQMQSLLNTFCSLQAEDLTVDESLLVDAQANIDLWQKLPRVKRSEWRSILQSRIDIKDPRVNPKAIYGISKARSRHNSLTLRNVLEWNPEQGALTTAELEILRQALPDSVEDFSKLSNKDAITVLLLRIFLATLRRTQQITTIRADGHKVISTEDDREVQHFLVVPKIKGQSKEEAEWEAIPKKLGDMLTSYNNRPDVKALQESAGYLLCLPTLKKKNTPGRHYAFTSTYVGRLINDWCDKAEITSPRTGQPLKVSMNRLRHTGATQMARQGQSSQVIQDILQHDSPTSASAYIDAVASDMTPMFERANRQLGGVFDELNNAFFKGKIVDTPTKPKAPGSCARPSQSYNRRGLLETRRLLSQSFVFLLFGMPTLPRL